MCKQMSLLSSSSVSLLRRSLFGPAIACPRPRLIRGPDSAGNERRGSSSSSSSRWLASRASETDQAATAKQRTFADMTIDNLDDDYCNDFVCNSSPAVEQTVRSLARDITRLKFNTNFFQPDVSYQDGFRSFKGSDKYRSPFWPREALKHPRVSVTKMAMLDNSRAQIDWLLVGQLGAFNVAIPCSSQFELNLLTGRVLTHTDSWDLSKLSPPAAAAVLGSRLLWSANRAGRDASADLSSKVEESLGSLTSLDEDEYYMNPNDPTRFFQKQDNTMNDAFMLATGVAALYLVYKVFEQLETLN